MSNHHSSVHSDVYISSSALYTVSEIKTTLDGYIAAHDLVNKAEQQYINVGDDALLRTTLYAPSGKSGAQPPEFAKRGELVSTLCGRMQAFYKIQVGNGEALTKCVYFQSIIHTLFPDISLLCCHSQEGPIAPNFRRRQDPAGTQGMHAHHRLRALLSHVGYNRRHAARAMCVGDLW